MRAYEFIKMPVKIGVQPVKWFGGLVVEQATQAARSNIIESWRRPWEKEVQEHLLAARDDHDFDRAQEQRALQACIEEYAPKTAEEFEELKVTANDKPNDSQLEEILGPTAVVRSDD